MTNIEYKVELVNPSPDGMTITSAALSDLEKNRILAEFAHNNVIKIPQGDYTRFPEVWIPRALFEQCYLRVMRYSPSEEE